MDVLDGPRKGVAVTLSGTAASVGVDDQRQIADSGPAEAAPTARVAARRSSCSGACAVAAIDCTWRQQGH
jgi:hypothetical protein